jgi:CheY-like chemotaxis protein
LTLARSLVELHGGSISARSGGVGQGSEFTVRLPALPQPAAIAEPAPSALLPLPLPRQPSGRRILVVDDNVDAAQAVADLLRELGHDVAVAHDGIRALALVRQFVPHTALVDIGLPVMDGYEFAQKVREVAPGRPLRLIAVTGYGQDGDKARSREVGFDAHLVKPVDLDTMMALLAD